MISSDALAWSSLLLIKVLSIAGRALVPAASAGLILAAFRVKSTSLRLFAWTSVLYAVVAISAAGWMLPPIPVRMPAWAHRASATKPPQAAVPTVVIATTAHISDANANRELQSATAVESHQGGASPRITESWLSSISISWSAVAGGVYLIIATFFLTRIVAGLLLTRRLVRRSETLHVDRIINLVSLRVTNWRWRSIPKIAESELISVPVTVGAGRSTILLPTSWRQWDKTKLNAVLSHELSHVARRDPLTQLVSLIHRAIFWFSPLAWWLDHQLKDLAEQASDEAALVSGADRDDYARTLVGFFASLQATPQRVWWQGVSMADAGQAEQRVERILAWRGAVPMQLKKSVALIIIAFAVPVVYVAASARPASARATVAATRIQEPPPPAEPSVVPTPPSTALAPSASATPSPAAPVVAPTAPSEPAAPAIWGTGQSHGSGHSYGYGYGYDDEQRFVIVSGKSDGFTMSGSSEDARHVERLKRQIAGDFIWFQRDEKSYIIRDQGTVDRALKLWAPQQELGKKQQALGEKQAVLGKQQAELGTKMRQVQVKVPDMTAELDKLRAELKSLSSSGATMDQVGRIQSEIGELQSKLGEVQSGAGDQQSKIGEEMSVLGEQQAKLGEEQGKFGRQQAELAQKASSEMRELLDEAIKKGTAKPEPEVPDSGTI